MDHGEPIIRREALKRMGIVAVGAALSTSGLHAAESINHGQTENESDRH